MYKSIVCCYSTYCPTVQNHIKNTNVNWSCVGFQHCLKKFEDILIIFFKKMGPPRRLFIYFRIFQANIIILQQINVKMSIQYRVLGFKPITFET